MSFIKDEDFIRGKCPMTKEDVRILSIAKMNLKEDSIVLDIGSGTGSISVQSSVICKKGRVVAIEKDSEALQVSRDNIEKFNCSNIDLINKEGSTYLSQLIEKNMKFDSIFVGGSGGKLEEIIEKSIVLIKENATIVMNFITLDNACKAVETLKKNNYEVDVTEVMVSKNRGNTLMMVANNPIFIIVGKNKVK